MRSDEEQFRYIAEQITEVERRHRPLLRQVFLSSDVRRGIRAVHRQVLLFQRLVEEGKLPTAVEVRQLRECAETTLGALSDLAGTSPGEREAIGLLRLGFEKIAEAAATITTVRPLVPRSRGEAITVQHPDACPGCGRAITARVDGRTVVVEVGGG